MTCPIECGGGYRFVAGLPQLPQEAAGDENREAGQDENVPEHKKTLNAGQSTREGRVRAGEILQVAGKDPGRNSENVTEKWEMCRKWGISEHFRRGTEAPLLLSARHWPEVLE